MYLTKFFNGLILFITFLVTVSCDTHAEIGHDHQKVDENSNIYVEEKIDRHIDINDNNIEHDDELDVFLSDTGKQNAGIELIKVTRDFIPEIRKIYGEIKLNEDKIVRKFPRYPGTVKKIGYNIGDMVKEGDTLAIVFNTETLSTYSILAAIDGEVLEKNTVVGEYIDGSEPILVLGNLESVWVDFHAYEKDHPFIQKDQAITIYSLDGSDTKKIKIQYISPIMNRESRSYTIRCILDNESKKWNPGKFVYAEIESWKQDKHLVVLNESIQIFESEYVVFQPENSNVFKVVPVIIGKKGTNFTEIIAGLSIGDQVVSKGSFFLKSELVTSSLSGHAGHGH